MNIYARAIVLLSFITGSSTELLAQLSNGDYYLLNVGANKYLGGAGNRGTQASLIKDGQSFTFKNVGEGQYIIDTHTFSDAKNHFLGSSLYLDSQETIWTVEEVGDGIFTMSSSENKYMSYDGVSTTLKAVSTSTSRNAQWKIVSKADMIASLKPNSDATFLIDGNSFSHLLGPVYGESYWNIGIASNIKGITLSTGNYANSCAEAKHTIFDVSQMLDGIPNGEYSLTAQGFYRQDGKGSYVPELYMGDESAEFLPIAHDENSAGDACSSFALNYYQIPEIKVTVYDGTLTIGTRLEKNENIWCCWDNMKLTYVKDLDLNQYKNAYSNSIRRAKKALDDIMNAEIKEELEAFINDNYEFEDNIDSYKNKVNEINNTLAEANKSAALYYKVHNAYNIYQDLDEDGQQVFITKAQDILERYYNGHITDGEAELAELAKIYVEAVKAQTTPESDMTAAIVNPELNGDEGWTCEKPHGGNGPMLNNNSFEYWAGANIDEDDRAFNYYQIITGLQNGIYRASCDAYNSMNGVNYGFQPSSGIYAEVGNKKVKTLVDTNSETFFTYTTPEIKVTNGTLKIGVANFNTMVARWFVADNFRLTLVSPDPALGIEETEVVANSSNLSVTYYSLSGTKLLSPQKGLNIKVTEDGKTTKVYVK